MDMDGARGGEVGGGGGVGRRKEDRDPPLLLGLHVLDEPSAVQSDLDAVQLKLKTITRSVLWLVGSVFPVFLH